MLSFPCRQWRREGLESPHQEILKESVSVNGGTDVFVECYDGSQRHVDRNAWAAKDADASLFRKPEHESVNSKAVKKVDWLDPETTFASLIAPTFMAPCFVAGF